MSREIRAIMDVVATAMVSSLWLRRAHGVCGRESRFDALGGNPLHGAGGGQVSRAGGWPSGALLGGGFEGDARLIRLLQGALRDLEGQLAPEVLSTARVGFYLALPSSDRERLGLEVMAEDDRVEYVEQLGESGAIDERGRAQRIFGDALRLAAFPVRLGTGGHLARVSLSGSCRGHRAVHLCPGGSDRSRGGLGNRPCRNS